MKHLHTLPGGSSEIGTAKNLAVCSEVRQGLPFQERESYKHRFAKNLLAKWLRDQDSTQDGCSISPISWRSNYGIFTELKFYETSDPYYFELSKRLKPTEDPRIPDLWKNPDMSFYKRGRGKILFVPDITIFHKGRAQILVEIVHSSPVSYKKLEDIYLFFDANVNLFEIQAEDILRQTEPPTSLPYKRLI